MKNATSKNNSKSCKWCKLCERNVADLHISNGEYSYYICSECDQRYFVDIKNSKSKARLIKQSIHLANKNKWWLPQALSKILDSDKRNENKNWKSSTDIYVKGRRAYGCFS